MQQQLQQLQLEVQEKTAENVSLKVQHAQTEQEKKTARDQLETRVRELEAEQQRRAATSVFTGRYHFHKFKSIHGVMDTHSAVGV